VRISFKLFRRSPIRTLQKCRFHYVRPLTYAVTSATAYYKDESQLAIREHTLHTIRDILDSLSTAFIEQPCRSLMYRELLVQLELSSNCGSDWYSLESSR